MARVLPVMYDRLNSSASGSVTCLPLVEHNDDFLTLGLQKDSKLKHRFFTPHICRFRRRWTDCCPSFADRLDEFALSRSPFALSHDFLMNSLRYIDTCEEVTQ